MTLPVWLKPTAAGVAIALHVVPGASRTAVGKEHDGRLKLNVAAPPSDGRANKAIIAFLAKKLRVPRGSVEITSGETGRRKRLLISGVAAEDVAVLLGC